MGKQQQSYHFSGNTVDIINNILSLLFGKEYYREIALYSNFVNDSQPVQYRKKIEAVLNLMQKENLILIRENPSAGGWVSLTINNTKDISSPSGLSSVYLRQYGKDVLSKGGYQKKLTKKNQPTLYSETLMAYSSELAIILILSAAIWLII